MNHSHVVKKSHTALSDSTTYLPILKVWAIADASAGFTTFCIYSSSLPPKNAVLTYFCLCYPHLRMTKQQSETLVPLLLTNSIMILINVSSTRVKLFIVVITMPITAFTLGFFYNQNENTSTYVPYAPQFQTTVLQSACKHWQQTTNSS